MPGKEDSDSLTFRIIDAYGNFGIRRELIRYPRFWIKGIRIVRIELRLQGALNRHQQTVQETHYPFYLCGVFCYFFNLLVKSVKQVNISI